MKPQAPKSLALLLALPELHSRG